MNEISKCLNDPEDGGISMNENLMTLKATHEYITDNLTRRVDRMFSYCRHMYSLCDPASVHVVFEDYKQRNLRLKDTESTCCQLMAFLEVGNADFIIVAY